MVLSFHPAAVAFFALLALQLDTYSRLKGIATCYQNLVTWRLIQYA